MKNYKFTKIDETTLIVGIDVGQNTHYGYLRTIMYEDYKSFSFPNSVEGFELLLRKIKKIISQQKIKNVVIGMESTGNYWLPLAYYLGEKTDYTIVQVNGKHTKRFKEVTDNTSNKTDQKDPKVVAQIVLIGSSLRLNLPQGNKAIIRELTRSRKAIMEDKKRAQNRVHALLSMFFQK
ncbi:MAG: IS110 family transposase [Bacteroidales bacterium]|nr:IS110 family transposase [Bacteroidales bacterium]